MSNSSEIETLAVSFNIYQLFKYALLVRFEQRFKEEVGISFTDRMLLNRVLRKLTDDAVKGLIVNWCTVHNETAIKFGESDDQLDQMIMFVLDEIWDKKGDARHA